MAREREHRCSDNVSRLQQHVPGIIYIYLSFPRASQTACAVRNAVSSFLFRLSYNSKSGIFRLSAPCQLFTQVRIIYWDMYSTWTLGICTLGITVRAHVLFTLFTPHDLLMLTSSKRSQHTVHSYHFSACPAINCAAALERMQIRSVSPVWVTERKRNIIS